ncbi:protoporphyrinogen/coproporphyrinogen oxidase [Vibrio owensii]|uniref:protoporphyrinogen/coproporphyrinogen oxidase n=1 Tax=Vibrio owensii TaxID=696485 RepID=UPI00148BBE25|nr:NAD(P)-binding protein [Vibrio owensii]NOI72313.1 NAD(P)-binding protein [Vibrio owensii]
MDKIVILGAGIAGISACYHAKANGNNATCFEKNSTAGGLVGNFTVQGFRFDKAIHMSFTSNEYVKSLFEKTEYISHKPNAYCIENKKWFKHPIQNNLFPLETDEKVKLITSFVQRPDLDPENYGEWLDHQYGYEIANRYPRAYTYKYWGLSPEELSTTWIGNRMRRADIQELLLGAFEKKDENHYYATEMRYPKNGGYFEFVRSMAEECDIRLEKKASFIDPENHTVHFSDKSEEKYSKLISTLPLPEVVKLLPNVPKEVEAAANSLLWTTIDLISIGFNKPDIPPHLWHYIYDSGNLASRAHSPSLKSKNNAPEACSSIQFEIYNLSSKERFDPQILKSNITEQLIKDGICTKEDILFVHHKHIPYGNVVFDHDMEKRRDIVLAYLDSLEIKSCGRFGAWDYFWSDQSFINGMEAVT